GTHLFLGQMGDYLFTLENFLNDFDLLMENAMVQGRGIERGELHGFLGKLQIPETLEKIHILQDNLHDFMGIADYYGYRYFFSYDNEFFARKLLVIESIQQREF